jgi:uncharacterized protein (DUF305 family)
MKLRSQLVRSVFLITAATAILGACGGSTSGDAEATTSPETAVAASADGQAGANQVFNEADVKFAQNMIPHHQQAVEMAVIALDEARGASAELKRLAERIQGGQQPEIDLMSGWLAAWGQEEMPGTEGMEGMDHSSMGGMEGMMTEQQMSQLEQAAGPAFDRAWMEMMIEHHQGAVAMAKTVQSDGKNPEVQDLAERIIAAQESEIAEMQASLGT